MSLIASYDRANDSDNNDEDDGGYGQFVGHYSDEFLLREESEVNNNVNIEGIHEDDSQEQVMNTLLVAASVIIVSLLINQSEEIQNFVNGWLSR